VCRLPILIAVCALLTASVLSGCGGRSATHRDGDSSSADEAIQTANLSVTFPPGWDSAEASGGYNDCSNPIVQLWLASYPLPTGFAQHEGPLVVPQDQVLLGLVEAPVGNTDGYWKDWSFSNELLRPATAVDGSGYQAEFVFAAPSAPSVRAVLWAGSRQLPTRTIAATNRLLSSLAVDRAYRCERGRETPACVG
jgi:hypothetical protein